MSCSRSGGTIPSSPTPPRTPRTPTSPTASTQSSNRSVRRHRRTPRSSAVEPVRLERRLGHLHGYHAQPAPRRRHPRQPAPRRRPRRNTTTTAHRDPSPPRPATTPTGRAPTRALALGRTVDPAVDHRGGPTSSGMNPSTAITAPPRTRKAGQTSRRPPAPTPHQDQIPSQKHDSAWSTVSG